MSEERHCELCHQQVWFGAYGTTHDHVDFTVYEGYLTHYLVCCECIEKLKRLPIIKEERR